jgi:hypothetical protein
MKQIKCANPKCQNTALDEGTGRHKKYCSDKCKQAAYRDRKGASPRKRREKFTLYTSTLERLIIDTWAGGDGQGAAALMELGFKLCMPLDMLRIESQVEKAQAKARASQDNVQRSLDALLKF